MTKKEIKRIFSFTMSMSEYEKALHKRFSHKSAESMKVVGRGALVMDAKSVRDTESYKKVMRESSRLVSQK